MEPWFHQKVLRSLKACPVPGKDRPHLKHLVQPDCRPRLALRSLVEMAGLDRAWIGRDDSAGVRQELRTASHEQRSVRSFCRAALGALTVSGWLITPIAADPTPRERTVLLTAEGEREPARITLRWEGDPVATSYAIARRGAEESVWSPLVSLPGSATNFVDRTVTAGRAFEYQVIKTTPEYLGYGYILSAIDLPLRDQQGTVVLIVADTYAADLSPELTRLTQDLVGDGWRVVRHDVSPNESVVRVKELVIAEYAADTNHLTALFLFGHVPIPYSGAIAPDGHPNHKGAWPADVFYGEMLGRWTDVSVTSTNAERSRNWNVPGDGKFDQDGPPRDVLLQVGRVDLSDLTCFANKTPARSEKDLLRQYLDKNHAFRHGLFDVERRALICDNFFDKGEDPIGASGWRNFSPFFGPARIVEVGWSNYFPNVSTNSYLWTFASGGGQYYTCTGVGSSDDFALQELRAVFTLWLGSYFGDWDNESNFLRAALGASPFTLTACYAGFPQWLNHPMGLGYTAGYCARLTQNNRRGGLYPPFNPGSGEVHVSLHGDPTLRMYAVRPPSDLTAQRTTRGLRLNWSASPDRDIRGYHVYRADRMDQPFNPLTKIAPITTTSFIDPEVSGSYTYMVRAIKAERTASGTFLNPSQGVFLDSSTVPERIAQALEISSVALAQGAVQVQVWGQPGQAFALEGSGDLHTWRDLLISQVPPDGSTNFVANLDGLVRYFRTRTAPP